MKNIITKRFAAILCCMFFCIASVFAQKNADAKYQEGLKYQQNVNNKNSQRDAIKCFRQAKSMYDSQSNKKKCDDAIIVSQNIIKGLDDGPVPPPPPPHKGDNKLTLSNEKFEFDCYEKNVLVTVTTNKEWSASPISGSDGTNFINISKNEDNTIEIECEENFSTKKRSQKIEVVSGDSKKYITIHQEGKPIILKLSKTTWDAKHKASSKSFVVYCNSETKIKNNDDANWIVESQPNWVDVEIINKAPGFLDKIIDSTKKLIEGEVQGVDDPSVISTNIKINIKETKSDREGEVVFKSENQRVTLKISQTKK